MLDLQIQINPKQHQLKWSRDPLALLGMDHFYQEIEGLEEANSIDQAPREGPHVYQIRDGTIYVIHKSIEKLNK